MPSRNLGGRVIPMPHAPQSRSKEAAVAAGLNSARSMAHDDLTRAQPLDIERPSELLAYLRRSGYIAAGEEPRIRVLAGGVSNRTVMVERGSDEAWVIKQALAKLRVAVEWFSDPLRIHREALGLRLLARLAPPGSITPFVFEDHEHHLFAMAAVPQPHENWKSMLLAGQIEHDHVRQFGQLLGTIHRRAWEERAALDPTLEDRAIFESLRLEPYYAYTAGQVAPAQAFLTGLIARTRVRRLTLVHGDYSPKNVLVHGGRLVLLDHEVIHIGDPAFDLGFSLTHLLSKAHHLHQYRRAFAQAVQTYWSSYLGALGEAPFAAGLEQHAVANTLGCLLARVAGRSPLEYLSEDERARQRAAVLALMAEPPDSVSALTERFLVLIER
ncbi:hypothetical protein EPN52_00150 [bacterium]|nr:MAG: hypothetical protein EPN52_00150 [bacterium]